MMRDFFEILDGTFDGFIIAIFAFICLIMFHYGYHYKDSRSIYTMKRLPNKYELHIRCFTVPVIGITVSIVISALLLVLFYLYYISKTPAECLHPDQWERLFTAILNGGK